MLKQQQQCDGILPDYSCEILNGGLQLQWGGIGSLEFPKISLKMKKRTRTFK